MLGAFLSHETFRCGGLSLLPAPVQVYPRTRNGEPHPCAKFDLSADAYKLGLAAAATMQLQRALDAARKFHHDLFNWHSDGLPEFSREALHPPSLSATLLSSTRDTAFAFLTPSSHFEL